MHALKQGTQLSLFHQPLRCSRATLQATQAPEPFILVLHADMLFRKALTPELLGARPGEPSDINGAIARLQ